MPPRYSMEKAWTISPFATHALTGRDRCASICGMALAERVAALPQREAGKPQCSAAKPEHCYPAYAPLNLVHPNLV